MHNTLKIALVQSNLVWENPEQNRINFRKTIEAITQPVDLIILPEMFTSGFTMHAGQVAENMIGKTIIWLQELAQLKQAAITGSLIIKENHKYYNRLVFVHPDGTIDHYNKRHTFTLAGEHKVYESGTQHVIITYKGWKLKPLVCYDLRFPVWSRNTEDYDVLYYVANWPKIRIAAWDTLLKARAIENMSYCIGVNRVGLDGNSYEHSGHSAAYDALGERIDTISEAIEAVDIITLEKEHLSTYRTKLGFLNDRDVFTLK